MTDISCIKGIITPILTPIDEHEKIDEERLRFQIDFIIDNGVHGILAFGSNGEFYMLDECEMKRGLEIIIDQVKGRVPVYMGIGAIRTSKCIELAKLGKEIGAFGISVLQPMFLKPTEEELYRHFSSIANAILPLPMLLYNNPGRTGYTLSSTLVQRLSHTCENIIGMKDSSGDLTQTSEFIRKNRDVGFKVFGGKDTLIYGALAHGAVGSVATTSNIFPKLVTSIYEKFVAGDLVGSLEDQFRLNPVRISMDKASFPVATKDMANIKGLDVGEPYLPSLKSSDNVMQTMKEEMRAAGLL